MPVNISIKKRGRSRMLLKARAQRTRSMQREVLSILGEAVGARVAYSREV